MEYIHDNLVDRSWVLNLSYYLLPFDVHCSEEKGGPLLNVSPKGAPRIHYVMKLFEDQAELDQELGIYR